MKPIFYFIGIFLIFLAGFGKQTLAGNFSVQQINATQNLKNDSLQSPLYLIADVTGNDVELTWGSDNPGGQWIGYTNNEFFNMVGLAGPGTLLYGIRFPADSLIELVNKPLAMVQFYPTGEFSDYQLKIFKGENAETLVHDQIINNPNIFEWNQIVLNTPVLLEQGSDYWVTFEISQEVEDYGASLDTGPAATNLGDLIYVDGQWLSLNLEYGLDFNWLINAYVVSETTEGTDKLLSMGTPASLPENTLQSELKLHENALKSFHAASAPQNTLKNGTINGFNIYRNDVKLNNDLITESNFTDQDLENGTYEYGVTTVYEEGESAPTTRMVQIGGPEVTFTPSEIVDSIQDFENRTYQVNLTFEGVEDLEFELQSKPSWIELDEISGYLNPGESINMEVTVLRNQIYQNEVQGDIVFQINNMNDPLVTLPVNITTSSLVLLQPHIEFGKINANQTLEAGVSFFNFGTEDIEITNISASTDEIEILQESVTIPGQSSGVGTFFFNFTPEQTGEYNETITLNTSDPLSPIIEIPVTATSVLPPPFSLFADVVDENNVQLSWNEYSNEGSWLEYGDGIFGYGVGLNEPGTLRIAHRWVPEYLIDFTGQVVTKMAFVPTSLSAGYTIKIWKGEQAEELVFSQTLAVANTSQSWVEVPINNAVVIEPNTTYWFGLEIEQFMIDDMVAAIDIGPAMSGYGDMANLGGEWFSLYGETGLDHNWMIRTFVSDSNKNDGQLIEMQSVYETPIQAQNVSFVVGNQDNFTIEDFVPGQSLKNIEILSYNIYRNDELIAEVDTNQNSYLDENLPDGVYQYGVTAVYAEGESDPSETTVQVGAPELTLSTYNLSDTLQAGEIAEYPLEITNSGQSELFFDTEGNYEWLSLEPAGGSLQPGETLESTITINTNGLYSGSYNQTVFFVTNNINTPTIRLDVSITIEGEAILDLSTESLQFGGAPLFVASTMEVNVTNTGNLPTYLSGFNYGNPAFSVSTYDWVIAPGESGKLTISFTPGEATTYQDSIQIFYFSENSTNSIILDVEGEGMIMPPSNVSAIIDSTNIVEVSWFPPNASPDELKFGTGENAFTVGTSDGTYEMAVKFSPLDLMAYQGKFLNEIDFYIGSTNAEFTLKIYKGGNASEEVLSLPLNNADLLENQWNNVTLPEPIQISAADHLWIGYQVFVNSVEFIGGLDSGPGVTGSGDLLKIEGMWTTLSEYGFSNNWNIKGLLVDDPDGIEFNEESPGNVIASENSFKNSTELLGYNFYKNGEQLNESILTTTSYFDEIVEGDVSLYGVTAVFSYGESDPSLIEVAAPVQMNLPPGWDYEANSMPHSVHIPEGITQIGMTLSEGNMIGAFYDDNGTLKCAGAAVYTGEHTVMTLYGDDPSTPEKDGFSFNETIHWKAFMHEENLTARIHAHYDHNMPHYEGNFNMMGLSQITGFELDEVLSAEDDPVQNTWTIFPNPSNGEIFINNLEGNEWIRIFDSAGRLLIEQRNPNTPFSRVFIDNKGIHMIEITKQDQVIRKKVIIR